MTCSPPEPLLDASPEEVLATVLADADRLGLWTAQPFLATMEGAVLSGRRAARVVLDGQG